LFLLIRGLLTSFLFLKETSKTDKKLTGKFWLGFMIKYYLHRLWRITPPYMLMLMITTTLTKYFGSGPLFPVNGYDIPDCYQTWWSSLLYITNLINLEKMVC
jgi:peptidoglycan/LPS O-acetylase OafA/YrhL